MYSWTEKRLLDAGSFFSNEQIIIQFLIIPSFPFQLQEFISNPLVFQVDQVYATQLLAIIDAKNPSMPIDVLNNVLPSHYDNHQVYVVGKNKFKF